MKFVVYSRSTMQNANPSTQPWGVISVCENGDFPEIHTNDQMVGRLNLQFHDVDFFARGEREDERTLFSIDMANEVLDFFFAGADKGMTVLYVHCLMGQCRSAAIAAALAKITTGDDMLYFSRSGPYRPNMRVYRTIIEQAHQRKLIG